MFDVLDENRSSFILCRANYLKDIIRQELEERGVFYTGSLGINQIAIYDSLCLLYGRRANITWHSFQIFLNVIRAGFLMEQKNKIKIPTYFREHQLNKETAQKFISPLYRNQFLSFPFDFCSFCMSSKITKTQGEKINNLLKKHNFGELPTGKIEIMTIHGSKGREAQDVFVLDAQTPRIEEACFESKDAAEEEARVFYVACTRSKEQLYIVDTSTLDEVSTQYKLPN